MESNGVLNVSKGFESFVMNEGVTDGGAMEGGP
jgi:hypothetical protein